MAIKPLNVIPEIKLKTLEDIADASANTVVDTIREVPNTATNRKYSPKYASYKSVHGRKSRQIGFVDLTFSGNTLDSYKRISSEGSNEKQTVGFTNKEAANVAGGWAKKGYDILNNKIARLIDKNIDEHIDKNLKVNFKLATGRTTIKVG
jgi:hypothetical protein